MSMTILAVASLILIMKRNEASFSKNIPIEDMGFFSDYQNLEIWQEEIK